jgi:hypothetical protein
MKFEMPFVFNLQIVLTTGHRCCSSLSGLNFISCGQKVAEWVKKTTFVPGTKKKE